MNNIDINNPKGHFTCKLIVTLAILVIVMIVALPIETYAQKRGELGIALGEQPELVEIEDLDGNALVTRLMRTGETYVIPKNNKGL